MKRYRITLACLISILLPVIASAQSAKDAVMALKKMEARVQSGIVYRDYGPALGEAKFPVNLYLENPESKKNPELTSIIGRVMSHYEQAGSVFKESLDGPFRSLDYVSSSLSGDTQKALINAQRIYKSLIEQYPEASKFIDEGGAIVREDQGKDSNNINYGRRLRLDYLLPLIFNRASVELKNASTLLSQVGTTVKEGGNEVEKLKKENRQLKEENMKLNSELKLLRKSSPKK